MQLYVMNLQQYRCLPKPRVFRNITSPLDTLTNAELIARYRLLRHCILELFDVVQPHFAAVNAMLTSDVSEDSSADSVALLCHWILPK